VFSTVPMMPQIQPDCVEPLPNGSITPARILRRSRWPITQAAIPNGSPSMARKQVTPSTRLTIPKAMIMPPR
jgi:hypothetical protein